MKRILAASIVAVVAGFLAVDWVRDSHEPNAMPSAYPYPQGADCSAAGRPGAHASCAPGTRTGGVR